MSSYDFFIVPHRSVVFWTSSGSTSRPLDGKISDLKGISPLVCTHHIYIEEEAKLVRQPHGRLNPHKQEVVRT